MPQPVGYGWADRSRIDRINHVLGANAHVSLADPMDLQADDDTCLGRRLTALAASLTSDDPTVTKAVALLKARDGQEDTGSAAAAIYEVRTMTRMGRASSPRRRRRPVAP